LTFLTVLVVLGLTAKELSPLFQEAFRGVSNDDRVSMREKMIRDISRAARKDPEAMNIKNALKLKEELHAQVGDTWLFL
jgi:hypothetical protein